MKKILLVDDNSENIYLLQVLFSSKGYKIISAVNGADALEKSRQEPPDIVLTDILMPVMDGFSFCKNWKKDEMLKDIPFIFYTATYTDRKDEEFALSLGADRFIAKPVEPEELAQIVLDVLNEDRSKKHYIQAESPEKNEIFYKQYNATLIRKLEQKMIQTEEANVKLNKEINERKKIEEALRVSLSEKETLLRELYHRTGNTIQLISSFLSFKLGYSFSDEIRNFVYDMQNRIQSMALVHKKLYESKNLSSIKLNDYVRELVDFFMISGKYDSKTSFKLDIEDINIFIDTAIPFGFVLNELISNSLAHAFPKGNGGEIKISIHRAADNLLELSFSDNGTGFSEGFNFDSDGKMGLKIISLVTEDQLKGRVDFRLGPGFSCLIRFNDSLYKQSI